MQASEERYSIILRVLGHAHLTTLELEALLEKQGARCPDDLAKTLNIMRRKGLIKGAASPERGAWVWWVE
jgi:hypothetical protein